MNQLAFMGCAPSISKKHIAMAPTSWIFEN
jgi:hypothetical protein